MKTIGLWSLILFLATPLMVFASVGVGVGTGKIIMNQPLKPGGIYNLPSLVVFNTGDEESDYEIYVSYNTDQPQLRPAREWLGFEPSEFRLKPGKSQSVSIKLNLPLKASPGDYFAYLGAKPVVKGEAGATSIGVAAATTLYFSVAPANILQAITFRISSFWKMYAPWTWIVLAVIIGAIIIVLFRKFFRFQIGVTKK